MKNGRRETQENMNRKGRDEMGKRMKEKME